MKTVSMTIALCCAVMLTIPLAGQETQRKGRGPRLSPTSRAMVGMQRLRDTLEKLDLTAEQKDKLGKVREEFSPKMREAFEKIRDILTEEQRNTAEEAMRKARDAGKEGREFALEVESSIQLTDEQKEKMDAIGKELLALQRDMVQKITEMLTPEQREKMREAMGRRRRSEEKS